MEGRELYERYVEAMRNQDVGVDEWQDLGDQDRAAWCEVAEDVADRWAP